MKLHTNDLPRKSGDRGIDRCQTFEFKVTDRPRGYSERMVFGYEVQIVLLEEDDDDQSLD